MQSQTGPPADAVAEQSTTDEDAAAPLPDVLESAQSKLVYLYLRVAAEADVHELSRALGLTRLSLFPVLETLTSRDLVERRGETYALVN